MRPFTTFSRTSFCKNGRTWWYITHQIVAYRNCCQWQVMCVTMAPKNYKIEHCTLECEGCDLAKFSWGMIDFSSTSFCGWLQFRLHNLKIK
jgi:hypothetical protein